MKGQAVEMVTVLFMIMMIIEKVKKMIVIITVWYICIPSTLELGGSALFLHIVQSSVGYLLAQSLIRKSHTGFSDGLGLNGGALKHRHKK